MGRVNFDVMAREVLRDVLPSLSALYKELPPEERNTARWRAYSYAPYVGVVVICSSCGTLERSCKPYPPYCFKCGASMVNARQSPDFWEMLFPADQRPDSL